MAESDFPAEFSSLNIPSDPLANFQSEMDQMFAQTNAKPEQTDPQLSYSTSDPTTCAGRNPVSDTYWYGWPDCCICTHCFSEFAANSPLVPFMPLQNYFESSPTICDMYSPRQRTRYITACQTGNIDDLLSASRERSAVWKETVSVILGLEAEREALASRAEIMSISAGHNAMIERYNAIGSLGEESNDRWTTDTGGVYTSWNGVVAEREAAEADALWAAAEGGGSNGYGDDVGAQIAELEARWAEVE